MVKLKSEHHVKSWDFKSCQVNEEEMKGPVCLVCQSGEWPACLGIVGASGVTGGQSRPLEWE